MADFEFSKPITHIEHGKCEPGDIRPLPDDVAARYVRHGWGRIIEPAPKPAPKKKPAAKSGDD